MLDYPCELIHHARNGPLREVFESDNSSITLFLRMDALLLLMLEALAAMALFIGIVWWTWPRKKRDRNDADSGN